MNMKKQLWMYILVICIIIMPVALSFAQGGNISGSLGLETNNGKVVHGDWIRVLLVTEKFEVKKDTKISGMNKHKRTESIINTHIHFFKKFREKMENPGYVAASTLTTSDGAFRFADVKAGQYYLVVTFPATINGCKVAWQVPAAVHNGETTYIELNTKNLALPTYSRNK